MAYIRTQLRGLAMLAIQKALVHYNDRIAIDQNDLNRLQNGGVINPAAVISNQEHEIVDLKKFITARAVDIPEKVDITRVGVTFTVYVPRDFTLVTANPGLVAALDAQHDGIGSMLQIARGVDVAGAIGRLGFTEIIQTRDEKIVETLINIHSKWQTEYMRLNSAIMRQKLPKTMGTAFQAIQKNDMGELISHVVYEQKDYVMADILNLTIMTNNGVDRVRSTTARSDDMIKDFVDNALKM